MTTILEDAINGYILTVFDEKGKQQFIYERLEDAQRYRAWREKDANTPRVTN